MIGYNIISPLAPENNPGQADDQECGKRQAMCYDKAGTSSMLAIEASMRDEGRTRRTAAPTRWGPRSLTSCNVPRTLRRRVDVAQDPMSSNRAGNL